ncbi:putative cupredoxin [Helianthus annuus]|nr:putative cupredoxin [Helianthus annuus]
MAVGRGSARVAIAALCLLVVVLQCEVTQAATYVVGDDNGWTSNIGGWEKGKTFKAEDILGILSKYYHHFTCLH